MKRVVGFSSQEIKDRSLIFHGVFGRIENKVKEQKYYKSHMFSNNEFTKVFREYLYNINDISTKEELENLFGKDWTLQILDGYFSDSSRMFCIGDVSEEKRKLVQVTKECVEIGLEQVKPWGFLGDMGQAVHDHAYANGYTVVREIGGHGVGLEFHEEPWVGYNTLPGTELLLVPGFMFTIEPMVNMGTQKIKTDPNNGWEVSTLDGKPSAQWEYQVLVTETGYEVISY